MASISKRGDYQCQVIVRRRGYPTPRTNQCSNVTPMAAPPVLCPHSGELFGNERPDHA